MMSLEHYHVAKTAQTAIPGVSASLFICFWQMILILEHPAISKAA